MNSYVQEVYSMLMEGHKEWAESEMESDKPAEVFDAHPISAMKVSDGDMPGDEDTMTITDTWKPEWQRGVQVPVNPPTEFPQTVVKTIELPGEKKRPKFVLPADLLRCSKDSGEGGETEAPLAKYHRVQLEEMFSGVCRYDVDLLDSAWIAVVNEERKCLRQRLVEESMVEHVVEALESLTHDKMQEAQRQVKGDGKGLEYDETVLCDVCKEPDGEDGNEMVFCDGCDVCVHQACYGILNIPEGNWLCRPCSLGFKAVCALCPKVGGALKPARDGARWGHVSCALWIPEVGFGDVEKMEPITKMTDIPPARWSLVCCLCRERVGACIQCAVKTCKIAFHVTCAHQNGLSMQQILTGDDVKMMAYCPRHSAPAGGQGNKGDVANTSTSAAGTDDAELGTAANAGKPFAELEASFHSLVTLEDLRAHLQAKSRSIPADICQIVHDYWKLKRRASGNQPLLKVGERPPVIDEEHARLVARMQMFITLRHDLERARNLCYMILRREKMKRSRFRAHETLVKSVCRHVKKNVKTLSDADLEELTAMPFLLDDIYDSGPTFAARCLVYARACPEQELMTRQELSRLQEQIPKAKRRNSDSTTPLETKVEAKPTTSKLVKIEARPTAGRVGKVAKQAAGKKLVEPAENEAQNPDLNPLRVTVDNPPPDEPPPDNPTLEEDIKEEKPKPRRGRTPLKRKRSTSHELQSTTEWVSVDDLIGSVSPIERIPRDQLQVSSDIKDRLRSGLMRHKYRRLIRSVGAASTSGGAHGPVLRDSKNIFDRLLSAQ